jgi:Alginate export
MKKALFVFLLAVGVVAMIAPPVMAQEEKPFTLHGEVRFRGEYNNNAQDLDNNKDDGAAYFPYRVRIAAEGHFTKNVSAWIEFQNAGVAGDTFSGATKNGFVTVSGEGVELYQGNLTLNQLWSKNFNLRIGRQELVAGNELLLGDLDFYSGISHDGGVGTWNLKNVNVMVWYTRPFEGSVSGFFGLPAAGGVLPPDQVAIASPPSTIHFMGGYATWNWKKDQNFDVYLMDLVDRGATANFQTLGVRYAHDTTTRDGFIWNVEVAQQTGDSATDVSAKGRAIEGWFGYNWKAGSNVHRIYGRLESATGDKATTGNKNEGFIPLFGDFHNRTGRGDWFQLADATTGLVGGISGGLVAEAVGYNGFYRDRHEFGAQAWKYNLQEDNGAPNKDLGTAIDVWYGFNYSRNVNFSVSLSQLQPGDALKDALGTGNSDSVNRLYGQVRLRF